MSARSSRAISASSQRRLARGRLQRRPLRHPLAWRRRAGRGGRAACGRHRAVGPGRRRRRRAALRASCSAFADLVAFDMGGTSTDISLIAEGEAALRRERRARRRAHRARSLDIASSAPAAARSPCRPRRHLAGRPGRARAPCRGRPATATAARSRPSPTPTSCSAISMPARSWAGSAGSTARPRRRRSTGSATALELSRRRPPRGIHRLVNPKMADGIRLMTRAPRRRSAALRAARLRRRGRAACHGGRARARDQARHGADHGRRCSRPGACCPATCATSSAARISSAGARMPADALRSAVRRAGAARPRPHARLV